VIRNRVEALYSDNAEVAAFLGEQQQISYLSAAEDSFRKVLLLAAASYFETTLIDVVLTYVNGQLKPNHPLHKIVKTKGIDRLYHTWFDWDVRNANKFFGMFGDDFKAYMRARIEADPALEKGIAAFMEIGSLRNLLVHRNFAEFTVDKTPAEIYALYQSAIAFVYGLSGRLAEFTASI